MFIKTCLIEFCSELSIVCSDLPSQLPIYNSGLPMVRNLLAFFNVAVDRIALPIHYTNAFIPIYFQLVLITFSTQNFRRDIITI